MLPRRGPNKATARRQGCGRSLRRRSPRQAPVHPPGNPVSAAILVFSRTSFFSSGPARLLAARDSFGRRQRKRGDPFRGSPSPYLVSILLDLVRAAPLWERSLSDRSYAWFSLIGIICTYLRPSFPSRNATEPSVSAKSVWSLPMPTFVPACHFVP